MSLLNRATDVVTVYPEVVDVDSDGNTRTRPSAVGLVTRAVVQPVSQFVGSERSDVGFLTEERLRLRLVGWRDAPLGAQSQVEWQGRRYSVHGEARQNRGSSRTAHVTYVLVRK